MSISGRPLIANRQTPRNRGRILRSNLNLEASSPSPTTSLETLLQTTKGLQLLQETERRNVGSDEDAEEEVDSDNDGGHCNDNGVAHATTNAASALSGRDDRAGASCNRNN